MFPKDFKGEARPLDLLDIPKRAHQLNVTEDHLRAFLEVEAKSRGFDREGRPVMLFEPHVFYRNIKDPKVRERAVKAGLAYRKWGSQPYPKNSYPRLSKAVELDEDAALKAASIGLSQVLVENYSSLGYSSPQQMWQKFMDDEEEHVEAMVRFILINGIDDDLREERWDTVARVYNGPKYRANRYAEKLAAAFAKYRRVPDVDWTPTPDPVKLTIPDAESLKRVQRRLKALGYPEVGVADGKWGTKTRAAVLGFRADNGLPLVADIDDDLLSALMLAPKRPVAASRAEATANDLRRAGSRIIKTADAGQATGVGTLGLGGVMAYATFAKDLNETIQPVLESLKSASPMLLLGMGALIVYQQWRIKSARLQDHREAKHVGRG